MKLFWSSRSPFVRKVMIAAHELGLADRIVTERVVVAAVKPNPDVVEHNPLGKIPTLILDDGTVLYDSRVILEFLDSTYGGSLIPPAGPARWRALTMQALADGIMEADLRWMEERNRPLEQRREPHAVGMKSKIDAGLALLEREPPEGLTIGAVAVGSALAHLDFRFPDLLWRPARPRLASWFETFGARPSMRATMFVDQY
ncbi:MAG: glutathione S-transferase [Devosia sp.]